jgi:hypothetical protein
MCKQALQVHLLLRGEVRAHTHIVVLDGVVSTPLEELADLTPPAQQQHSIQM